MITEYWLISAPGEKTCQETWDRLNASTQELSSNFKFSIPDLKVGTLDQLVGLSDDLIKLDAYTESITKKLVNYFAEILEDQRDKLYENLQVQGKDISHYVTKFQWDTAKYPVKQALRNITEIISKQVTQIDSDLKAKAAAYNHLKNTLSALERKATGSLLTKDLADIVKKEDFIVDSEYLTTVLVVVQRSLYKEWEAKYEGLTMMVVPRSSKLLFEDNENGLFAVTLFKKVLDEFRNRARENKFFVRDFVYDENALAQGKNERNKLAAEKNKQFGPLVRWLKINFSELFSAWIHVKALRVFVESVLRYGLPVNFQAVLLQPNKRTFTKRLRDVLSQLYAHLDVGNLGAGNFEMSEDVSGLLSFGQQDYYPYVFFKINIDLTETSSSKAR
ncbi:V-type proton ATPase subunit C [Trichinella nativa]|uniref:V-type proton ATPase subunit C n=1 Tax=Trichinella nativa TaxID=6335 RepID=A0A0V1LNS2_9BILA|nr:V-type proton ATPase subunit C [Trichinella sp. T6]KRZ61020.1 V-type proton ATPase subunit C [Trichinella nativa]OUC48472.1 v-ATPase subunit C [Trichinella nativa]